MKNDRRQPKIDWDAFGRTLGGKLEGAVGEFREALYMEQNRDQPPSQPSCEIMGIAAQPWHPMEDNGNRRNLSLSGTRGNLGDPWKIMEALGSMANLLLSAPMAIH